MFVFSISCKNEPQTTETNAEATNTVSTETQSDLPGFDIETEMSEEDTPNSTVSILVGGKKLEITKVNACEKIEKADYVQYQIPAEAIAACGGWWAGAGDYFYIVDDGNNNYTVMQGMMDEGGSSDSYNYKMVMKLSNKLKPK
jgi:hypothetical protein